MEIETRYSFIFRGFGSISWRSTSFKPLIAADNGIGTFCGGTEIMINCDLVIAAEEVSFILPEVRRGVIAAGRYVRIIHFIVL